MAVTLMQRVPADTAEVERLLDTAFGLDRRRKLSYGFRTALEPLSPLSLSARDEGRLVGTISAWPIAIGDSLEPALLLGPIAVDASVRGQGLGSRLVNECIGLARTSGYGLALLVGDLAYYGRFGFTPSYHFGITMPGENPDRLLALKLRSGAAATGDIKHWRSVRLGCLAA